jgi:hypothetical protein
MTHARSRTIRRGADVSRHTPRCGTRWSFAPVGPLGCQGLSRMACPPRVPWTVLRGQRTAVGHRRACHVPPRSWKVGPRDAIASTPAVRTQRGRRGRWSPGSPGVGACRWRGHGPGYASSRRQHKGGVGTRGRVRCPGTGAHATRGTLPGCRTAPGGDTARSTAGGRHTRSAQRGPQMTGQDRGGDGRQRRHRQRHCAWPVVRHKSLEHPL